MEDLECPYRGLRPPVAEDFTRNVWLPTYALGERSVSLPLFWSLARTWKV